ncbi:MAG TPA: hypothetical protein VE093_31955 [Polyangiaceae bacterium]|nr:hypothetical protein [Polyangiaceae bacterium]
MHARARIFLGILAAGIATTTAAWAANNGYHGSLCNPFSPNDVPKLKYDKWGVRNISVTEKANVTCGASPAVSSNVTKVEVVVYDRDPVEDVCCSIYIQKAAGNVITSAMKCSSGFASAAQTLSYSPPVNAVETMSMVCSIPKTNPANGDSHVVSYRVNTN